MRLSNWKSKTFKLFLSFTFYYFNSCFINVLFFSSSQADFATQEHQQKVEMIRWTAQIKKAELQKTSLEEAVEKKKQENTELLSLCDSLIQKVK